MITYHEQTTITVKLDGSIVGHIFHDEGKGFYYKPKSQNKRFVPEYHSSLPALKRVLEEK